MLTMTDHDLDLPSLAAPKAPATRRSSELASFAPPCAACAREVLAGPTSERTVPVDVDAILRDHPELLEEELTLEAAQRLASATRAHADARPLCARHRGF